MMVIIITAIVFMLVGMYTGYVAPQLWGKRQSTAISGPQPFPQFKQTIRPGSLPAMMHARLLAVYDKTDDQQVRDAAVLIMNNHLQGAVDVYAESSDTEALKHHLDLIEPLIKNLEFGHKAAVKLRVDSFTRYLEAVNGGVAKVPSELDLSKPIAIEAPKGAIAHTPVPKNFKKKKRVFLIREAYWLHIKVEGFSKDKKEKIVYDLAQSLAFNMEDLYEKSDDPAVLVELERLANDRFTPNFQLLERGASYLKANDVFLEIANRFKELESYHKKTLERLQDELG